MTRVKVCGVRSPETLAWIDGAVDYVGFVYTRRPSPRRIEPLEADSLASTLSKSEPVLVVHGLSPRGLLEEALRLSYIRVVQIHDHYPAMAMAELARMLEAHGLTPAPVALWEGRGWSVDPCRLRHALDEIGAGYEYILADRVKGSPAPPLEELARAGSCIGKLGVAGGLNPGKICDIDFPVFLVDASSWPEYEPGRKDPGRVLELRRSVEVCLA